MRALYLQNKENRRLRNRPSPLETGVGGLEWVLP